MTSMTRRAWLKHLGALSSLGAAAPLGLSLSAIGQSAKASGAGDYKALVCIFMYGGNDAFNTVLTTDADNWAHYQRQRNSGIRGGAAGDTSLAYLAAGTPVDPQAAACSPERLGGVLPIDHTARAAQAHVGTRSFALHPLLQRTQDLYGQGQLAVLANVGPLVRPTSKADFANDAMPKPAKLFSHNDQQSTWQTLGPEGSTAGWGGRMADLLMSGNGLTQPLATPLLQRSFTCLSPSGNSVWLAGEQVLPFVTSVDNVPALGGADALLGQAGVRNLLTRVMTTSSSRHVLAQDYQSVVQRALAAEAVIQQALAPVNSSVGDTPWASAGGANPWADPLLKYVAPADGQLRTNYLAMQLQMVARLIDTNRRGNLGMRRQVFMVMHPAYDHHDRQLVEHADRMAQLDHALGYFNDVLARMPGGDLRSQVTTFTSSEFGRTLTNNGDGTDHGWGSHHLIMGGAVQGGDVYGRYPQLATADAQGVFDSPELLSNGVMLPSTSVEQYAYTLGRWMGVSSSDLRDVLPNLSRFDSDKHDLGFMG